MVGIIAGMFFIGLGLRMIYASQLSLKDARYWRGIKDSSHGTDSHNMFVFLLAGGIFFVAFGFFLASII